MADTEIVVIGAGVVGLAVAARLATEGRDVVVLERRERHGQETSSRNSEVIHAGIYYPAGSWKARLCVRGRDLLYELCGEHGLAHRKTGKLVVAGEAAELPELDALSERAAENAVHLEPLTAAQVRALEPNVRAVGGLLSPQSGVLSAHELMDFLLSRARQGGAVVQPRAEVVAVGRSGAGFALTVRSDADQERLSCEVVVNAAGLEADTIAGLAGIDVDAAGYRQRWCKGSYFAVAPAKARIVSRLVYPVPGRVSLGVHAVVDGSGRLKFGPDADYLEERRADYAVDESKRAAFARAVSRLVPAIGEDDLTPDMSGIRPKLQGPGEPFRDFVIREESDRGLPGFVNLIGIDSPGLTACLAIGETVEAILAGRAAP